MGGKGHGGKVQGSQACAAESGPAEGRAAGHKLPSAGRPRARWWHGLLGRRAVGAGRLAWGSSRGASLAMAG